MVEQAVTDTSLANKWETERLAIIDSTLEETQALQQINDLLPTIKGWTGIEVESGPADPIQSALVEGVLPPNGSKESFRLQSIRLRLTDQLIGFLGTYHGFPDANTLWIIVIAIHPSFQRQGYGSELMVELSRLVARLEPFARMRGFIGQDNLPSLRFFVQAGFDRIVTIAEDATHAGEFHFMLEKSLRRSVKRVVRYQGAVVRDGHLLLVRQRFGSEYECWNVPGGGREDDETEEQCVVREIKEETNLDVRVEHLLIDGLPPHGPYQRFKTYLCTPVQGRASPDDVESVEVRWFDLCDPSQLSLEALNSATAFTTVQRIRQALGYT